MAAIGCRRTCLRADGYRHRGRHWPLIRQRVGWPHADLPGGVREDGAEAIILGGLGLAGIAQRIAADVPVPLIDNVVAGVRMAEAAASLVRPRRARVRLPERSRSKSLGLTAELAGLLEQRK